MEISGYRQMCDKLCTPECTPYEINLIKAKFHHEIKSERLMEKINSLKILIKVLERRDEINRQNLQIIADMLKRPLLNNDNFNCKFERVISHQQDPLNGQGKYNF